MTKNTKSNKKSNMKKLVPAAGMLAVSAVMLSTSTYAWFTMNKEVKVTGLTMSATTGDSLTLTLGALGDINNGQAMSERNIDTTKCGEVGDAGWTSNVNIDEYYYLISKLKPASSDNALSIYKLEDESKIFAGGQSVKLGTNVVKATNDDLAGIVDDGTYYAAGKTLTNWKNDDEVVAGYAPGYYVDIPMWLRSSSSEAQDINCWVSITDPMDSDPSKPDGYVKSELIKAVRVAIIPLSSAQSYSDDSYAASADVQMDATAKTLSNATLNAPRIFALDSATYDFANNGSVLGAVGGYAAYVENSGVKKTTSISTATEGLPGSYTSGGTTVFRMPAANKDTYAMVKFIARVWLEGESKSCNDATAGQNWKIDFHFNSAGGNTDLTPVPTTPPAPTPGD